MKQIYYATGRRKVSTAKVWLSKGSGKIIINKKDISLYFHRPILKTIIEQPFNAINIQEKYNVIASVKGSGHSGQAGAIQNGIAKALIKIDKKFRPLLKKLKLLTRDPRMVERKKYGQAGARKKFQHSKR